MPSQCLAKYKGETYLIMHKGSVCIPDFKKPVSCVLTIKMPDGSVLASESVTVGGTSYTTNASGQVTLPGNYGDVVTYQVKYSTNYWVDVSVTFGVESHTATLVQHVVAGSVSVSIWNFSDSSWTKKAYSLTVPELVKVIKITGSGFDGWSDDYDDDAYIGTNGDKQNAGATVIYNSTGSFTKYVGVTAEKTYTLYGRWIKNCIISWSDDINKLTADVNLS